MRSLPAPSFTKVQVLSTVVTLPSGSVNSTLPSVLATSPWMSTALLAISHLVQPFRAKPVSLGKAGLPPTKYASAPSRAVRKVCGDVVSVGLNSTAPS
ncbi:hypothetical protein D3C72_2082560 [compost metagenome]